MQLYLSKCIAFYLGCLSCYLLQTELQLSAVTAAATVGLGGSFLHFPRFYEKHGLHAAIYAGAFAGMSSPEVIRGHWDILILSLIGALFFVISRRYAGGYGGRLGVVAFVSS